MSKELRDALDTIMKPRFGKTTSDRKMDWKIGRDLERKDAKIAQLRTALSEARLKLTIYRVNHSGEYQGGMEFTALISLIDKALESDGQ